MTTVRAFILDGFDDAALSAARWDELLGLGDTDVVYLTRQCQSTWWDTLGRGRLMLVAGERDGRIVALAPLYAEEGMLFFVGSGHVDYMDFIGDIESPDILEAVLGTAARAIPEFCGFRLYAIPGASRTGPLLQASAASLGWACGMESPFDDEAHRQFLDEVTQRTGDAGWPRLTWLEWQGRPIACEFGRVYRGAYLAEVSCYDVALAERSPGQVLQRELVLAVLRDGLTAYDFGTGDYPYKRRYATDVNHVETWGLFHESTGDASGVVEAAT